MNTIKIKAFVILTLANVLFLSVSAQKTNVNGGKSANFTMSNNVTWTTLGKDENDSMPLGNGDLAANVWTESNGDLLLLLSKSDAWTETGALVKLGRVRIQLSPNPFIGKSSFLQTLRLDNGSIEIKSGANSIIVWIDANNPVMHVEASLERPAKIITGVEFWRKTKAPSEISKTDYAKVMSGEIAPKAEPDILFPAGKNNVLWCHYNPSSSYPNSLRQQHLELLQSKFIDPLHRRTFGAYITGDKLSSINDYTLASQSPAKKLRVDILALTQLQAASPHAWQTKISELARQLASLDLKSRRLAHELWWGNFWNRSWIHLEGSDEAAKVSQGYIMQRYMMACSSRGEQPPKFNGGLFTVGRTIADTIKQNNQIHNPDYRKWGDSYWNQNNRFLFWPLIQSGDFDLLKPWFNMYLNALPLAKEKTKLYYHHDGASFPETMSFWGMPRMSDFGRNNPTNVIQSNWTRYHVQGALEVIAQMLDVYDHEHNIDFARNSVVPFADEIITYYDQHWPRHPKTGKIFMSPAQSLETYQLNAINPTPDIAGLMNILPRMLALPAELTSEKQRVAWNKTLRDLPDIPIGKTANGKVPPFGVGDRDGRPTILPAENYGKTGNGENPELYVAFPYRIYGVGKPGLELGQNTFAARRFMKNTCWGQDGTQAAVLGLTSEAQKSAVAEFTNYGEQRFPWFWRATNDWIPDLDNGGSGMITLQLMLMQCDGAQIQLLPAWPDNWTADFKLHAPFNTTVEGHVENGKISNLKVIPASRAKDVIIVKSK